MRKRPTPTIPIRAFHCGAAALLLLLAAPIVAAQAVILADQAAPPLASLLPSEFIAGNNVVGSTNYPNGNMKRIDAVTLPSDESNLTCAVMDADHGYAYFGTTSSSGVPATVVKVALSSGANPPVRVGAVTLEHGEESLSCAVIDAANGYAWFATGTVPAKLVKVALGAGAAAPARVGAGTLAAEDNYLLSGVIDTAHGFAYFGSHGAPGQVVKVALGAGGDLPERVGAITLHAGEDSTYSAVIDSTNGYAYFGTWTTPGNVVKVALGAGSALPTRIGAAALNPGENQLRCASLDATNGYAYFGTATYPGQVVNVALGAGADPPARAGAVTLNGGEDILLSAVLDAGRGYAWFGTGTSPGRVVKVALGAGANPPSRTGAAILNAGENLLQCAALSTASGYVLFGAGASPGRVVKVALGSATPTRVGSATLKLGESSIQCAAANPDAGIACFGTATAPGHVVKMALGSASIPASRVGSLILNDGEDTLRSAVMDTAGYAYFGTDTSPGRVVKAAMGAAAATPSRAGAVTLNAGEEYLRGAVIDAANGYAYFAAYTSPGQIIKVALGSDGNPPTRIGSAILNAGEDDPRCGVIDVANGCAYFGTDTSPGQIVKVALGAGATPPSRVDAIALDAGEDFLQSAAIDPVGGYAWFGTWTAPGVVVQIALGAGAPVRLGAASLNSGENSVVSAAFDPIRGYAYFGVNTATGLPGNVARIAPGTESSAPTHSGSITLDTGESGLLGAAIDPGNGYVYFGTNTNQGYVPRIALTGGQQGAFKGSRVVLPGPGTLSSVRFYSHIAAGSVRLALYDNNASPALLWASPSISNTANGDWLNVPVEAGTPANLTLASGVYWLAWQTDSAEEVASYATGAEGDGFFVAQDYGLFPAQLQTGTATAPTFTSERWSEYLVYVPDPIPPDQPGATAFGLNAITWTWQDNSGDEDGFNVYADPGADPPNTLQTATASDVTAWRQNGLDPNTEYAFEAAAFNNLGESARTPNFTAWTLIEPVAAIDFTSVTPASIAVTAANPPSNLAGGASGILFGNDTIGADSGWRQDLSPWTFSSLQPNTAYTFRAKTRNGAGIETAPATASAYTLAAPPLAPLLSSPGKHSLNVAIAPGDGNPSYTIYALRIAPAVNGNAWIQPGGAVGSDAAFQSPAAWGTLTVAGLTDLTTYTVAALAQNGAGVVTAPGPDNAARTLDGTPPAPPIVTGETPTENTQPTWTWISGGGGDAYFRYQLDSLAGTWIETVATNFAPLSPLSDGAHTLYVQERDDAGNWSASGSMTIVIGENEGEGGAVAEYLNADENEDHRIELSELLRVIQFFNMGGYHCQTGTEDGYAPGLLGSRACAPYNSDYNPQDWQIRLNELLRVIQFFNSHGYHPCPDQNTEDGYCPGL
jgi:hypothetical protein